MTTDRPNRLRFPDRGSSRDEIRAALAERQAHDVAPHGERNFRPNYYVDDETLALIDEVSAKVAEQNVLYAGSSYPSLKQIEAELVEMGLDLFHAPVDAGGTVTTGGSESNFLALKTARDRAAAMRPQPSPCEVVLAHTAHPSFEKAAHLLGVTTRRATASVDFHADVATMAGLISPRTIMMVGSAPPAAYGQTDPIAELAALAARHDIWFHVDSCMGGFFLPFAKALGEPIPDFDFRVPGVWSLSADLHKFGYAPKGASLLLLADRRNLAYQEYRFEDWPWGLYATTGFAGSRPAAPIVAAWSVLRHLGRAGYERVTARTLAVKKRLIAGIRAIPGLDVVGRPDAAHFFVCSPELDVYAIEEELTRRGWALARARLPDSFQVWPGVPHETSADAFLADMAAAAALVRARGLRAEDRGAVYTR
ncbi:MAG: aspartate aminotransferase family protein [Alphaproteobacteria bacterium]|nr:aspartate aminotransferase family protein [Alphaproteobacteria bacterium]